MNKKLIRGFRTNMALSCICLIAFTLITIPFSIKLAIAEALVSALVIYVGVRRNKLAQKACASILTGLTAAWTALAPATCCMRRSPCWYLT